MRFLIAIIVVTSITAKAHSSTHCKTYNPRMNLRISTPVQELMDSQNYEIDGGRDLYQNFPIAFVLHKEHPEFKDEGNNTLYELRQVSENGFYAFYYSVQTPRQKICIIKN
ncbi:MAG: hypothetical protein ISR65_15930 [Bacteriovoracaceae bacterium]|nr:hypothetical protein [Bacteriovoracaceae bacterium]